MKPIKIFFPIAVWCMRIGLLLYAFINYTDTFTQFNLTDIRFYVAGVFILASVLIFISGFSYNPSLSVLSGLAITVIMIYSLVVGFNGSLDSRFVSQLFIASIGMLFLSKPSRL